MLRQQNVAGIATVHHASRYIDPGASEIGPFVYIENAANWPAVNSHPKLQARFLERTADLHRALRRRFRTRVKYQRHPVAGGDLNQTIGRLSLLKLLRRTNDLG